IDRRPVLAYMASKVGESFLSASSASRLIRLSGCPFGTRSSVDTKLSIIACCVAGPRMATLDHTRASVSIPAQKINTLLVRRADPWWTVHTTPFPRGSRFASVTLTPAEPVNGLRCNRQGSGSLPRPRPSQRRSTRYGVHGCAVDAWRPRRREAADDRCPRCVMRAPIRHAARSACGPGLGRTPGSAAFAVTAVTYAARTRPDPRLSAVHREQRREHLRTRLQTCL